MPLVAHHTQPGNEGMAEALRAALPACIGRGASITSTAPAAASLFGENNPRLAARPRVAPMSHRQFKCRARCYRSFDEIGARARLS